MNPKVSILIPVFKAEKYISKCLETVLGQSYQHLEIVIVDDASPDNSMAVVESKIKEVNCNFKIIIHRNKNNQGVAATRNTLLDLASGDYIQFVDSDDYIDSKAIESLVEIATKYDCDIVKSGYFDVKNNTIKEVHQKEWSNKTSLLKQHLSAWDSTEGMPFLFIRRILFEKHKIRFSKGINASEDHLMTLKLFFYANIIIDNPTPVYYYLRDNEQSITHVNPKAFHDSMYKAMDNAISFLKENGVYEIFREEALTRTFLTKQTFLLNKNNRDIDLYLNTHPECNSYYRKFKYSRQQVILFKLAEYNQRFLLKLLTHSF